MSKLLSIIIPTYNMEALLPRCLDSLLVDGALEQLEAIVVNDGSRDGSLAIANSYKERFPDTVTVIDKPNGNYGSTINTALPVAKGKYVKILDSDDYFNSDGLICFIAELQSTDADMLVTHFTVMNADGKTELSKYNVYGKEPYTYGKLYELDNVLNDGYIRFFLMHGLAYRTELLRQMNYRQTEGVSYTDLEWVTYPLFVARSIVFFNINLYQYNLAREGQTMDSQVMARNIGQLEKVTERLIQFTENHHFDDLSSIRQRFLRQYYLNRLRLVCKCHLLDMPRENFDATHFSELDARYQQVCQSLGLGTIRLYPDNKILHFDAMAYWHHHHHRWPSWFERFNSLCNRVMKKMYVRIFR